MILSTSARSLLARVRRRLLTQRRRGLFAGVAPVPADPILGLVARFKQDRNPHAVNLAQGAYRDDAGAPFVLKSVIRAEARILADLQGGALDKEYLGIEGSPAFLRATARFALGDDSPALTDGRVATLQSLSGTGALRLAADALAAVGGAREVFLSTPSWGNHAKIFQAAGLATKGYTYLDAATGTSLDLQGMLSDLSSPDKVPAGSVVLLHACAHNPTGVDPTPNQWRAIADVFEARGLVPLFDSAYQGYASGDPVIDAFALREFDARSGGDGSGIPRMVVCQSYAKNMGLYGERVGAVNFVCATRPEAEAVLSHVKQNVVRPMYSSPPLHGARVATLLLEDSVLHAEWCEELALMSDRIAEMRRQLVSALEAGQPQRSWRHITDQIGMFAYTGLSQAHVTRLLDAHGIYLTSDGRMSLAGLKSGDVDYVAKAVLEVLGSCPEQDDGSTD